MKRVVAVVTLLLCGLVPFARAGAKTLAPGATTTTTTVPAAVPPEAGWLLAAQLSDGAIPHYADRVQIWPYLANFAAMGLARTTEITGDKRYTDAAWRWLAWYQRHQDANGYVTDYTVAPDGTETSKGDMDSTDAYAGTFLLAVRRTWLASGDRAKLDGLRPAVAAAVRAIQSTQDADGLTWAKPSYRVKYLMDQAEVYAGLRAAAELAKTVGDQSLSTTASGAAQRVAKGVAALWNPATSAYDWAVHDNGQRQAADWSVFYPDAQQQVWAVAFGLTSSQRSGDLVGRFTTAHPNWDRPAATDLFASGTQQVEYWPVAGWAVAKTGDTARAATAATNIRNGVQAQSWAWPFTTGNAGQLITLASLDDRSVPA